MSGQEAFKHRREVGQGIEEVPKSPETGFSAQRGDRN